MRLQNETGTHLERKETGDQPEERGHPESRKSRNSRGRSADQETEKCVEGEEVNQYRLDRRHWVSSASELGDSSLATRNSIAPTRGQRHSKQRIRLRLPITRAGARP